MKAWGNHWENGSWVPNYLFISLQWLVYLCDEEKFIYIVKTHWFLYSKHIHYVPINETFLLSPKSTFLDMIIIADNGPEDWNGIFKMIYPQMDTILMFLHKMIQMLLWKRLSLGLLQESFINPIINTLAYPDKMLRWAISQLKHY